MGAAMLPAVHAAGDTARPNTARSSVPATDHLGMPMVPYLVEHSIARYRTQVS